MDISIALFLVEMMRAGTGEACRAAAAAQVEWQRGQAELAEAAEALAESLAEEGELPETVEAPGFRVVPGVVFAPDPIGDDPAGMFAPAGPDSIAHGAHGDPDPIGVLPDFLEALKASGVLIEPGASASGSGPGSVVPTPPLRYRLREYTLYPPTPFVEPFSLMVPNPLPAGPRPLLVVFHKYGASQLDAVKNTDYVRECAERGWFLVCPLGGSKKHFSSIESQANTQAVLDWVLANASLRIDTARIYGVGFSMGGGALLNYAARHRDPAHVMIAAIVNHTGNTSLTDTYRRDPPTRYIFDYWYGDGSAGSADSWKMTRSSVIDFNSATLEVDKAADLARNLGSTPLATWRAEFDPIPYLQSQNDILDQHLRQHLGRQPGPTYSYTVVPFTGHEWRMLDAVAACDWLEQFTLQIPLSGRTLADVDGTYDHFFVEQDVAEAFTPFDWTIDPQTNSLTLDATANLRCLSVDPLSTGLSSSSVLRVATEAADGTADDIAILRWPSLPSAVMLDGFSVANWQYDPATRILKLLGSDGAPHVWTITP